MISADVKSNIKQQEIKLYKKYLQNFIYSVKRVCIFHLILIDIASILLLSVKNRGAEGLLNGQSPLSVTSYLSTVSQLKYCKGKPSENLFNIARNQEFELITSHHFKTHMEQSMEYSSLEKIKVKASLTLSILFAHISDFFKKKEKKKRILRKSSKPGHGNLFPK